MIEQWSEMKVQSRMSVFEYIINCGIEKLEHYRALIASVPAYTLATGE
jgi:hypothetical protein